MILQMVASQRKTLVPVNPNYKDINVAHQLEDEHSVLNFTKIDSIKNRMIYICTDSLI